jgi:hypothetical protein
MTDKILDALGAITSAVFSYRPADKGQASAKIARRVKRMMIKENHDDRESSI